MSRPRYPGIHVTLRSRNPYALVSAVRLAMRRARIGEEEILRFTNEVLGHEEKDWFIMDEVFWEKNREANEHPGAIVEALSLTTEELNELREKWRLTEEEDESWKELSEASVQRERARRRAQIPKDEDSSADYLQKVCASWVEIER